MSIDFLAPLQKIKPQHIPLYDFHMHTVWTDGESTVQKMHEEAVKNGLKCILFTEHARKESGAWFYDYIKEVRSLPQDKCQALAGVETKILNTQGDIDLTDDFISRADLVMASVHRFPGEKNITENTNRYSHEEAVETEFRLAMGVLDNPNVDILGHPFGMTFKRFNFTPDDGRFREVIKKAARTGVAVEVNCHYHPDPWKIVRWCQELGARISLGSNAHRLEDVGKIVKRLHQDAL